LPPGLRPVARGGRLDDPAGAVAIREPDDTAAEARAGRPRADHAGLEQSLDEGVELGRRGLEVVPATTLLLVLVVAGRPTARSISH